MSLGKYSPTVSKLYAKDQQWHNKFKDDPDSDYDKQGYDSYGYDANELDRVGQTEFDYLSDPHLYEQVLDWCERNNVLDIGPNYLTRTAIPKKYPMCGK